jgi:DNA-binding LacI/PurR family transcriptional regulator
METMGSRAVEVQLEAIAAARGKKPLAAIHRKAKPELIVRQSTAAFRK